MILYNFPIQPIQKVMNASDIHFSNSELQNVRNVQDAIDYIIRHGVSSGGSSSTPDIELGDVENIENIDTTSLIIDEDGNSIEVIKDSDGNITGYKKTIFNIDGSVTEEILDSNGNVIESKTTDYNI